MKSKDIEIVNLDGLLCSSASAESAHTHIHGYYTHRSDSVYLELALLLIKNNRVTYYFYCDSQNHYEMTH